MSKKIIIADRESLPRNRKSKPKRLDAITTRRLGGEKEIITERDDVPTAREIRAARREIKKQARLNRDTYRRQRVIAKRSVTAIDFQVGDLVHHREYPDIGGLVMDITIRDGEDAVVSVMIGQSISCYRGKSLRRCD